MTKDEALEILERDNDAMRRGYFCINDFTAIEKLKETVKDLNSISREDVIKAIDRHTFNTDDGLCLDEDISIILEEVAPKQDSILEKIRAEIEALPKTYPYVNHIDMYVKVSDITKIIGKYRA